MNAKWITSHLNLLLLGVLLFVGTSKSNAQFKFDQEVYLACVGTPFTLEAPTSVYYENYRWYLEGVPFPIGTGSSSYTVSNVLRFDNFFIVQVDSGDVTLSDTTNLFGFLRPQLNLGDDQTGCDGDTLTISDSWGPAGVYTWNTGQTGASIKVDTSGLYICTKKENGVNPCEVKDTVQISLFNLPMVNAGRDTSLCPGNFLQLNGEIRNPVNAPYTYAWSPNIEITDTTQPDPFLTTQTTRTYYLDVTDGTVEECAGRDSITLSYFPPLETSTTFEDTLICAGSEIPLGVQVTGGVGVYNFNWDNELTLDDPGSDVPVASPEETTTYVVLIQDTVLCFIRDTVQVNLSSLTATVAEDNLEKCNDETILLEGFINGGQNPISASWYLNDSVRGTTLELETSLEGTYILELIDSLGCQDTTTVTLTNNNIALPEITSISSPDSSLNTQDITIKVTATGDNLVYLWSSDGDGQIKTAGSDSSLYDPATNEEGAVVFEVEVSNECGETNEVTQTIFSSPEVEANILFIPNILAPAESDVDLNSLRLYSTTLTGEEFSFQIFNRNGVVMFETTSVDDGLNAGWTGVNASGEPVKSGIYTYVVKGIFGDGEAFERVGSFTLVR